MTIVYALPAGRPGAMDVGPGVQDAVSASGTRRYAGLVRELGLKLD